MKAVRKDITTILAVITAAFLMALNNKTFVSTGGLYPGGVTGLTILIQRIADMLWGISLPFSVVNILLNSVPPSLPTSSRGTSSRRMCCSSASSAA